MMNGQHGAAPVLRRRTGAAGRGTSTDSPRCSSRCRKSIFAHAN